MRKGEIALFIFVFVILSGVVSASFEFDSYKIDKEYNGGELVRGMFNMSFSGQKNVNFTSGFEGGVSLLDALEKSGNERDKDFECAPANCKEGLNALNGALSKTVSLEGGEKKIFGFKIVGENVVINDAKIHVISDASATCSANQLSIDLFDDNSRDFINSNYVDEKCGSKRYGCFDGAQGTFEPTIGGQPYCEKVTLPAAPSYRIGARVKNSTEGKGELTMEMYEFSNREFLGDCILPTHSQGTEDLDCILDYSSKNQFDAFICIYADAGNYKIKAEGNEPCGKPGVETGEFTADYEIYAQDLKYGMIDAEIDETLYEKLNEKGFVSELQNYVNNAYNAQCEPECVIPFSIFGINQEVVLDSVLIDYDSSAGTGINENRIYDISKKEFVLSSVNNSYLDFDIGALEFKIPEVSGSESFELEFDGQSLFEEQISISTGFKFEVNPKFVLIGRRTLFRADIENVSSSIWDFGDGDTAVSANNEIEHTYAEEGTFDLEVKLVKISGENSTRSFTIRVGDARQSANLTIKDYEERIRNIGENINSLPEWIKTEIRTKIDAGLLNNSLEEIKKDFELASVDEEYLQIVNRLLELRVPYDIATGKSGELPAEIGFENIDIGYLEELSEREVLDKEKVRESVIGWIDNNYDIDIDFELISAFFDSGQENLVSRFVIDANPKGEISEPVYLVINYPIEEIIFKESYNANALSGGIATYIPLSNRGSFEFLIPEEIEVSELGVYVSPEISAISLGISEDEICEPGDERCETPYPAGWVVFWVGLILFVTLFIYVILQEWYKRRYESYLFKNKNDLYNMITFIHNARESGLKKKDIKKKLSSAGWKGEQIAYAFKKIDGKRTGMFEIPILKFFENKKVREEIEKRQSKPLHMNRRRL